MEKYLLDKQLPNITSQKFIAIPKIIQEDKWIINTDVKHFFFEDVALIKFDIPMQFNDQINKICIPMTSKFKIHKDGPKTKSWYGKILDFAGWGKTNNEEKMSPILQHVNMKIMRHEQCFRNFHSIDPKPNNWKDLKKKGFCLKGDHNEGTCKGDSGGAAVWKDDRNNKAYVIGIASEGNEPCDAPMVPSKFSSIPGKVAKWIKKFTKKDSGGCFG